MQNNPHDNAPTPPAVEAWMEAAAKEIIFSITGNNIAATHNASFVAAIIRRHTVSKAHYWDRVHELDIAQGKIVAYHAQATRDGEQIFRLEQSNAALRARCERADKLLGEVVDLFVTHDKAQAVTMNEIRAFLADQKP